MDAYSVQQPGVRVLWCLRRRAGDVRCLLLGSGGPVEVHVLQDRDLVLTEYFQDEGVAEHWARAFSARLREQGWDDTAA